jgi:hypothetical protein
MHKVRAISAANCLSPLWLTTSSKVNSPSWLPIFLRFKAVPSTVISVRAVPFQIMLTVVEARKLQLFWQIACKSLAVSLVQLLSALVSKAQLLSALVPHSLFLLSLFSQLSVPGSQEQQSFQKVLQFLVSHLSSLHDLYFFAQGSGFSSQHFVAFLQGSGFSSQHLLLVSGLALWHISSTVQAQVNRNIGLFGCRFEFCLYLERLIYSDVRFATI